MAPLLCDHESILIKRIVYHPEPMQRGDVVVFEYPLDGTRSFIKRIVALPGESVDIRHGRRRRLSLPPKGGDGQAFPNDAVCIVTDALVIAFLNYRAGKALAALSRRIKFIAGQ